MKEYTYYEVLGNVLMVQQAVRKTNDKDIIQKGIQFNNYAMDLMPKLRMYGTTKGNKTLFEAVKELRAMCVEITNMLMVAGVFINSGKTTVM